ncbi:predicted protein [Chaetomium globosum CBS 148.51]|uniref:Uncharacterized protein n=1 Tax=Chaetomium globosum (strain ATCC 6205 / CBS 148.51 / DSM 1962 / NBRC 6347 / NRRL 1970) TaxID=306901 RepID=Q2HD39_CHAGB|nr:uncharacterized protein CHGG_01865 [Chaetomium globosum CBS 148.51]EAQ93630.1 predicted protein [Chaetomium globosum CBS 148.51]
MSQHRRRSLSVLARVGRAFSPFRSNDDAGSRKGMLLEYTVVIVRKKSRSRVAVRLVPADRITSRIHSGITYAPKRTKGGQVLYGHTVHTILCSTNPLIHCRRNQHDTMYGTHRLIASPNLVQRRDAVLRSGSFPRHGSAVSVSRRPSPPLPSSRMRASRSEPPT